MVTDNVAISSHKTVLHQRLFQDFFFVTSWETNEHTFIFKVRDEVHKAPTLEATMSDLFPTGQTTISQSVSSSVGTSTNHSDSIS